jgi:hypothetical protein
MVPGSPADAVVVRETKPGSGTPPDLPGRQLRNKPSAVNSNDLLPGDVLFVNTKDTLRASPNPAAKPRREKKRIDHDSHSW